jgi:hypothetical protein
MRTSRTNNASRWQPWLPSPSRRPERTTNSTGPDRAVATSEEERLQEAHLPNQGRLKLIETSNVSVCAIDV